MQKTFDELVSLKQDGKIGWKEFLLQSEYAEDYQSWLNDRHEEPTEANATAFSQELDNEFEYMQNENMEGDYVL